MIAGSSTKLLEDRFSDPTFLNLRKEKSLQSQVLTPSHKHIYAHCSLPTQPVKLLWSLCSFSLQSQNCLPMEPLSIPCLSLPGFGAFGQWLLSGIVQKQTSLLPLCTWGNLNPKARECQKLRPLTPLPYEALLSHVSHRGQRGRRTCPKALSQSWR